MLTFFLTWTAGSESIFLPSLRTNRGRHQGTRTYVWPDTVTIEFFLGIKFFLNCTNLPVHAKVMNIYSNTRHRSLKKMLEEYMLGERETYEKGFEFDEFYTSSFDDECHNHQYRKLDRLMLDQKSFCNKYVRWNFSRFCSKRIPMRYIADICAQVGKNNFRKYKKIHFNSTDLLKGFLSLNEFTMGVYQVKVGQVYENFQLCQLIIYHPNLFYSFQTIKHLFLEILPVFYNELIDLILSFFSFCESKKFLPSLDLQKCDLQKCENLGLDHLYTKCYRCGGGKEIQNIKLQKTPLITDVKILPFP